MFVQDFHVVDVAFESVANAVAADTVALVEAAFEGARPDAEGLRARVGPEGWPSLFSKTVDLQFAPARFRADGLVLSFRWTSVGGTALVPTLEGELEFAPLGERQTQLVFRAQYDPPAGALGRGLDRLLLHRVAESTARAFVTQIASGLAAQAEDRGAAATD